jgi:hypothetical protein
VTPSVFGDADHFFTAIGPNPTIFVCAAETFGLAHTTADGIAAVDGIPKAGMSSWRRTRLRRSSAFSGDREPDDVAGKMGKGLKELNPKVEVA